MADELHLDILNQGVDVWNRYRKTRPGMPMDLGQADLRTHDLRHVDFSNCILDGALLARVNLTGANLSGASLVKANLYRAHLTNVSLTKADLRGAMISKAYLMKSLLMGADLSKAHLLDSVLTDANLFEANLSEAILLDVKFDNAILTKSTLVNARCLNASLINVDLCGAILDRASFAGANLFRANLANASLFEANLSGAILRHANFKGANLRKARLVGAFAGNTDFSLCDMNGAILMATSFVETNFDQAVLTNCKVYGLSAWNLQGIPKDQSNLVITPTGRAAITVDDLQVAQFVYLLLNNKNVHNVINTITSKAVLILGRFTPKRKEVLDLIREELGKHDYVPILFDFENTPNESLLETVMILAGMACFVIADVTAATMVREELRSIVEKYPAKPIVPLLLSGKKEYDSLKEMRIEFNSVLPTFRYKEKGDIVLSLYDDIIAPAKKWLEERRFQIENNGKTLRETELKKENETLKKQLTALANHTK